MARELRIFYTTGATLTGKLYVTSADTLAGTVSMSEAPASSGRYVGTFPALAAGTYDVLYLQGSTQIGAETLVWDGTAISEPATTADVTILPVSATVSTGEVIGTSLVAYQNSDATFSFGVTDANGDPINLTGKTVAFYAAYAASQNTPVITRQTSGSGVTISGDDNSTVNVALTDTHTANLASFVYSLWNVTDDTPLARGSLEVLAIPQAVP